MLLKTHTSENHNSVNIDEHILLDNQTDRLAEDRDQNEYKTPKAEVTDRTLIITEVMTETE